jgi:uncharacterized alkaline shock family protein YloU
MLVKQFYTILRGKMKLKVEKKHGNVIVTDSEIIKTIHKYLLTVPGVALVGSNSVLEKLINKPAIEVYSVRENEIGIKLDLKIDHYVRIVGASSGIQENVKYIIEDKYGINVDHIDVNIKGIKNEN